MRGNSANVLPRDLRPQVCVFVVVIAVLQLRGMKKKPSPHWKTGAGRACGSPGASSSLPLPLHGGRPGSHTEGARWSSGAEEVLGLFDKCCRCVSVPRTSSSRSDERTPHVPRLMIQLLVGHTLVTEGSALKQQSKAAQEKFLVSPSAPVCAQISGTVGGTGKVWEGEMKEWLSK